MSYYQFFGSQKFDSGPVEPGRALGASAPSAGAALVYQRRSEAHGFCAPIIAARNDGTDARVIEYGYAPRVSPSGHRVAYVRNSPDGGGLYVVGNRGRHRHRLVKQAFNTAPVAPIAWSPDERFIVVGNPSGGARLIHVRHRKSTRVATGGEFGGASFTPDGDQFTTCSIVDRGVETLVEVNRRTRTQSEVAFGCDPLWDHVVLRSPARARSCCASGSTTAPKRS